MSGSTAFRPWLYLALIIASLFWAVLMVFDVSNPFDRRSHGATPEAVEFWASHGSLYSDGLQLLAEARHTVTLSAPCIQGAARPDPDCTELAARFRRQADRLGEIVSTAQALEAPSTDKTIQAWLNAIIAERGEDARTVRQLSELVQPGVSKVAWPPVVANLDTQPHRGEVERATDQMLDRIANIQNTNPPSPATP